MFQDLLHTITTFIMVAVVAVTGVLHRPTFTPVTTSTPTPSPVVEQVEATPSASITPKVIAKPKVILIPATTPTVISKPQPISVQEEIEPIPTIIPSSAPQNPIKYPPTYRTLALYELGTLPTNNQPLMDTIQSAYSEFLQTPNLSYLTPDQQRQLFERIATNYIKRLVDQQTIAAQQQLIQKQQELDQLNSIAMPTSNGNSTNNNYQTCLDNKVASINKNPYLSESSRLGQIERAKYDCASQ